MSNPASALAAASAEEDDYQAFYAVLSASARGRAFLDEHARRHRQAETDVLLAALQRLEHRMTAPAQPLLTELGALLDAVRDARAQIDPARLSATVGQLVATLDTVQHRLSALLPRPAAPDSPAPAPPVQPPFALALTAVAAQALAEAVPEEEPIKVLKSGSIPPPPPFAGEDFSATPSAGYDSLSSIMALSEEERLALFS